MTRIFLFCLASLLVACGGESVEEQSGYRSFPERPALAKRTPLDVVAYLGAHTSEIDIDNSNVGANIDHLLLSQNKACQFNHLSQCSEVVKLQPGVGFKQSDALTKLNYLSATFKDGQETLPATLSAFNFFSDYDKQRFFSFNDSIYAMTSNVSSSLVWRLQQDMSWKKLTGFDTRRHSYGLNQLDDQLILTGGCSGDKAYADMWLTSDAKSWQQKKVVFPARCGHATAVFKHRLWLVGGRNVSSESTPFQAYSDVWSYSAKEGWQEASDNAPFGAFSDAQLVSFSDSMILVIRPESDPRIIQVWSTSDGVVWQKVKHDMPKQNRLQLHKLIVHGNELWLYQQFGDRNQVWHSKDGQHWEQTRQQPAFPNEAIDRVFSHDGALWISFVDRHEIWRSGDGDHWQAFALSPFPNSHFGIRGATVLNDKVRLYTTDKAVYTYDNWPHSRKTIKTKSEGIWFPSGAIVSFKDRFWLFNAGLDQNTIYVSDDGDDWRVANSSPEFEYRDDFSVVSFNDKLWLIGGRKGITFTNDVWSSVDGIHWSVEAANILPTTARYVRAAVFKNKLWVTATDGLFSSTYYGVYSSYDGVHWSSETSFRAPASSSNAHTTLVFNDQLWLISVASESRRADIVSIHRSGDGHRWEKVAHNLSSPASNEPIAFIFEGYLWFVWSDSYGTKDKDKLKYIWRTKDGEHWQKVVNTQLVLPDP